MRNVIFGIVKDAADKDALGRVQVDLLDFNAVTLPWIPVLQPLASKKAGIVVLPEKGDHVVVLVGPSGLASDMMVIGSLYTPKTKPLALGAGKAGDPLVRGMITPAGNQIAVSDEKGKESITIQTKQNDVGILLDGKKTTLTLSGKTEIIIQSPQGKVTVKAKEAMVDAGTATVKASQGGVVVDGGAKGVEVKGTKIKVSGSAQVEIAAGMVKIG